MLYKKFSKIREKKVFAFITNAMLVQYKNIEENWHLVTHLKTFSRDHVLKSTQVIKWITSQSHCLNFAFLIPHESTGFFLQFETSLAIAICDQRATQLRIFDGVFDYIALMRLFDRIISGVWKTRVDCCWLWQGIHL